MDDFLEFFNEIRLINSKWNVEYKEGEIVISSNDEVVFRIYKNINSPNTYFLLQAETMSSPLEAYSILIFLNKIMK